MQLQFVKCCFLDMLTVIMGGLTSGMASQFILTKHPKSVEQLLLAAEAADFFEAQKNHGEGVHSLSFTQSVTTHQSSESHHPQPKSPKHRVPTIDADLLEKPVSASAKEKLTMHDLIASLNGLCNRAMQQPQNVPVQEVCSAPAEVRCYNCDKVGHYAQNCNLPKRTGRPRQQQAATPA